ncbi:hypothetical protein EJB05_31068, partial [Eragrostis curvula]
MENWEGIEEDKDPPSLIASNAFSLATTSFSLSIFPSWVSITSLTFFSTSSALTNSSYPIISTPIFISSTMNTLLSLCSAYKGQQTIGRPDMTASSVEFHPQCVTNAPTASCCTTSAWGTQSLTTIPLPLVLSKNPAGSSRSKLCSSGVPRTAHKKRWPELSNPRAISCNCAAEKAPMLPKQRNTTLRSGCASSHAMHSCRSPLLLSPRSLFLPSSTIGPMQ